MPDIFCRIGRCSHESKRGSPKTAPRAARHFGLSLSLATSCAIASETQCVQGRLEQQKDLRNDRFWVGNADFLSNDISLIAHRHRSLRLPCVRLESGATNTQKWHARHCDGVREFTQLWRPFKRILHEATDTSHRETDQRGVQMGCRRNDPINTRNLPTPDNTDPIHATPTHMQKR